jgi:ankyrin repeat protein
VRRPDNLRLILEREPHIATAFSRAPCEYSALHYACERGGEATVEMLRIILEKGGDAVVNRPDAFGETPLHVLCRNNHACEESVALLRGAGASVDAPIVQSPAMRAMGWAVSLLEHVPGGGSRPGGFARLLAGGEPGSLIGPGATALQFSSERGDAAQAQLLLATGEADAGRTDAQGRSPVDKLRLTHPDTAAPAVLDRVLSPFLVNAAAAPRAGASAAGAAALSTPSAVPGMLEDMLCCRRR